MTKGFTLIEVMVVMSITVIITGLLLANFSRTRVDLNQTALTVRDAIREAQSMALSGAVFGSGQNGTSNCGYGIHFAADGYTLYAGPVSGGANCVPDNYGYDNNGGTVRQVFFSNTLLEIRVPAPDIFFEPPDPKTYFIGSGDKTTTITIHRKGTAGCDPTDCRQIDVTTSGQIQTR